MAEFKGKWLLKDIRNLHKFCEELQRKLPQEELHTVEYVKDEETGEYTQTLLYGNNFLQALWLMDYGPQKFKSGEQFKHKDLSGSDSLSTITVEGNKLTHEQLYGKGDDQVKIIIVREVNGDNLTAKFSFETKSGAEHTLEADYVRV